MNSYIEKHIVGALCVCLVITASFAFSAFMFHQPTPPAEAAAHSMIAQPVADGSMTAWTGFPKPSWGYVNIDETINCNSSDYNFSVTPAVTGGQSAETYLTRLSTIPNTKVVPANDGSGNLIRTAYRITKIEVTPCLGTYLPAPKTSHIEVFYRFAQDADSKMVDGTPRAYTVTSDHVQTFPAAVWTTNYLKNADSALEVGVRYVDGDGGAKVSQLKTKLTYDVFTETIPAPVVTTSTHPTITKQSLSSHALANIDQDLMKFQVSSDNAGPSYVKQMVFKLSKSAGVSMSGFRIRRGASDMSLANYAVTYVSSPNVLTDVEVGSTGSASGTGYVVVSFTNEETIAGSGYVYTLHAAVSGASSGNNVQTAFYVKSGVPLVKGFLQNTSAYGVLPEHADIYNIDTSAIADGVADAAGDFLWSDGSALPHSAVVGQGSRDWLNGVNLVNLTTSEMLSMP